MKNPKHEIRSTKQYLNSKFKYLNLFRIFNFNNLEFVSDFDIRISNL